MISRMLERMAGLGVVRRTVDWGFRSYAHRRARWLEEHDAATLQQEMLLHLVRKAAGTQFGRDHDFGRIRSVADFQRRVPLRTYEDFWNQYWKDAYPFFNNLTWPGSIPYFALSS